MVDLPAAVTLVNTIPELVLAGNPVTLKFQASDNLVETEGTFASVSLLWTAAAYAGEHFDLLLAGETVRFTCAATPDNSGVQFHNNSGSLALAAWVAIVAADLWKNYLIARYYTITVTGATMTITANETGDDYSQEFTAGTGIDVTATETNKAGTFEDLRAFYAIAVLLYCNDEFVTEILLNVDDEGYAEADVSKMLESYLTSAFSWPESETDLIISHAGNIKTWYFKYGERWGDGEYTIMTQSSTYYVLTGGISWMLLAKYNAAATNFWTELQAKKRFLTWSPLSRYITPGEHIKLYYLNYSAATTLTFQARHYDADGNESLSTIASMMGVADKAICELILSPSVIPYSWLESEALVKIEIWLEDQDPKVVSEVRTFFLDYSHYEHERYFLFKNSFGVYEFLRTVGLMSAVDEYSRESAQAQVEFDYETDEREEVPVLNTEQQRFTVACGWLSKFADAEQYRNWLRDFALSREVYLIDGDVLKPVNLTGSSFDHGKDRDTLSTFSFEFENAFSDEFFAEEPEEEEVETEDIIFNSDFSDAFKKE